LQTQSQQVVVLPTPEASVPKPVPKQAVKPVAAVKKIQKVVPAPAKAPIAVAQTAKKAPIAPVK
tara:strand:- start:1013 stop:1204 length:192 start_codon:yes stop_codon:yes gene_type:complete